MLDANNKKQRKYPLRRENKMLLSEAKTPALRAFPSPTSPPTDQRAQMQIVLGKLIEPFRKSDRDEAMQCLTAQGGLDACHLASTPTTI